MSRNYLAIRICLILMVIVVSLGAQPVYALGGTVVRVDPAAPIVNVNDSVILTVKVDNIANLIAFELHLSFNPGVLEVVSLTNGGFVAPDAVPQTVFDNTAGTIDFAVAQFGRAPASGSGTLLTIALRAKSNGSSTVVLRPTLAAPTGLLLSDLNGTGIQVSWANGNVTVGGPSATPVTPGPATATPITPAPATATPVTPVPATATPVTPGVPSATPVTPAPATATPVTPGVPSATPVTPAAATATVTATPTLPTSLSRIHTVRLGESLYCIGRAYKISPMAIASVNGIWWPYIIFPSQNLTIPTTIWSPIPVGPICKAQFSTASSSVTPTVVPTTAVPRTATPTTVGAKTATPSPVPATVCRIVYVVVPGDTLYHIATSYGTSYFVLARVNQIPNARLIYPGQRICIP